MEENDGGNGADVVLQRDLTVGVGVELADHHAVAVVIGQVLDRGCQQPAGHAPLGPEVHKHGLV